MTGNRFGPPPLQLELEYAKVESGELGRLNEVFAQLVDPALVQRHGDVPRFSPVRRRFEAMPNSQVARSDDEESDSRPALRRRRGEERGAAKPICRRQLHYRLLSAGPAEDIG